MYNEVNKNKKITFSIEEKNEKYFTNLSKKDLDWLVAICEMRLGGFFEYETPNKLDKDSVEEIYTQLVNITEFDPNNPMGSNPTRNVSGSVILPRNKFIKSLDKDDVISFLLKYGELDRGIEITRQIVGEQKIWRTLPDKIDANEYKKGGIGDCGYDTPTEEYIHEEVLTDDDYNSYDEEGELGWSEIGEYNMGDYNHKLQFSVKITLPEITFEKEEEEVV